MRQANCSSRFFDSGFSCQFGVLILLLAAMFGAASPAAAQDQDDEIVASLAGGRVIVHATRESITFIAIDEPIETGSVPPRILSLDGHHIGVLLGATEWRIPADPTPIRLDKGLTRISGQDQRYAGTYGESEADLETMGVAFLEKLTPLAARLHHKLDFPSDQPLFEIVIVGFGPRDYGPEVWTAQFHMTQTSVAARGDYWQTRVLRPRFEQIYPPDKKAAKKMIETCYPGTCKGPTIQQLLEGNEPDLEKLAGSNPKFLKAVDVISKGQAQKAVAEDAAAYLRAAVPLLYPNRKFVMGTFEEQHGFDWIVPPDEPVEKAKKNDKDDKDQPTEAPTLRRRADPPQ
jgi:hypothetical protein